MCEHCEDTGFIIDGCGNCSGSGEGMYDGSTCQVCKGSGEVQIKCECEEETDEDNEEE